jgi:hypothetical protein
MVEDSNVKRICRYLLLLMLCSAPLARAQGPFNIALGFGSAQVPSNGLGIDINSFASCTPSATYTTCERNPALGRLFMGFDGDALLNKRFGFGGELTFQPVKGDYGPIQYRQEFYDFNGLYQPLSRKRLAVRLEGGIGGAHTGFSVSESSCVGIAVCSSQEEPVGSANHFQEHAGVGIQVYLTHSIFIRPQFDYRHVTGFDSQFGRDSVLQGSVWVGYNFGTF